MNPRIKDIDSYIALQPAEDRAALQKIRELILALVPDAEEVISYNMPAFKFDGMLAGFLNCKNHIGFYPWNSRTVAKFKAELTGYQTSPGAIQLPKNKPVPVALIKKIVKERMKENIEAVKVKKIIAADKKKNTAKKTTLKNNK